MPQTRPGVRPVANGLWESNRQLLRHNELTAEDQRTPQPWDQLMEMPPGPYMAQMAIWVGQLRTWGFTITQDNWDRMLASAVQRDDERDRGPRYERPTMREIANRDPALVYYVRVGSFIKIGYTRNLAERMKAYPPYSTVLATEPGDQRAERIRLDQFIDNLAHGREWFHPSAALIEHINSLREQPLTPADLAA